MTNNETVTITQTEPDGTETTIEITQTKPDDAGDDQSLVEEVIEAIFDTDADNADSTETDVPAEDTENGEYLVDQEQPVDFGSEVEVPVDYDASTEQTPFTVSPVDVAPISEPAATEANAPSDAEVQEQTENAELDAHAEAAREAQAQADEFAEAGDYKAASDAREAAENEAWQAGDSSMLDGSNSTELDNAAQQQEFADYHKGLQDEYTAQGDYEAAQAEADKVVENTSNADYYASGNDHTAQARDEEYKLGDAVWEEGNADYYAKGAEEYAAQGDLDSASQWADNAAEHQQAADYDAGLTTDGSTYDASSQVDSGGSYEAATDYSSYDSGAADYSAVDTSATDYSSE